MAIAKKCDICGELYEVYNLGAGERVNPNGIMLISEDGVGGYIKNKKIDCCPECMESIKLHIDSLKNSKKPIDSNRKNCLYCYNKYALPLGSLCTACEKKGSVTYKSYKDGKKVRKEN